MQLIATARLQAALTRANATKPYAEKLSELVVELSRTAEKIDHPLLKTNQDAKRSALVVITSNRGLCGGYNANVLRTAIAHLDAQKAAGVEVDLIAVGKKGVAYFRFLDRTMAERITHLTDRPKFADAEPIANRLMEQFSKGEIAGAHVAFMRYLSASRQRPVVVQLLPLIQEITAEKEQTAPKVRPEFEFSPEPKALLDELLPATVRMKLFQSFTEATVSEQIARMVAMKAATDAAGDMIKLLSRKYNRARQTQITMELLDIVGGANALA